MSARLRNGDKAVWLRQQGPSVEDQDYVLGEVLVTGPTLRIRDLETDEELSVPTSDPTLRAVVTAAEAARVVQLLGEPTQGEINTWRRVFSALRDRFQTGRLDDAAIVFRDLNRLLRGKQTSGPEAHLLNVTAGLLVRELALVQNKGEDEVLAWLAELFRDQRPIP